MEMVKMVSIADTPWTVRPPMPRINDLILDTVIFLYRSRVEAEDGVKLGGTGFLTVVDFESIPGGIAYAVSNRHVVAESSAPVIRLNTQDGNLDVIDVPQEDWSLSEVDDLAILPLGLNVRSHRYKLIPSAMFLSKEKLAEENIGPGDDVFMVGRFVDHEGVQKNLPTVRFGNIAMMPWEPLPHNMIGQQESFVVEMRSISGYSGSPVFVHIPMWSNRQTEPTRFTGKQTIFFLGVDWGHIYDKQLVRNRFDEPLPEGWFTRANSGMAGVIPAWKLWEMLNSNQERARRAAVEKHILEAKAKGSQGFSVDAAGQAERHPGDDVLRQMLKTPP